VTYAGLFLSREDEREGAFLQPKAPFIPKNKKKKNAPVKPVATIEFD